MSSERIWTDGQKAAINSLDGTILVSAAAGSGKTAVLVERIIKRITSEENPSSIDRLLVVTFTKAAAAEMKDRLSKELSKYIENDPKNLFLKKQKLCLPEAQICTIDSFCSRLVRENYEKLSVSPDFTVLSENDNALLLNEAADRVLRSIYENGSDGDKSLLALFTNEKDDQTLRSVLIKMYDLAFAAPSPEQWIENAFTPFFDEQCVERTPCGEYTFSILRERILFILEKIDKIILDSAFSGKLETTVRADLEPKESELKDILLSLDSPNWDEIRNRLSSFRFSSFGRFKQDEKDDLFYDIKSRREIVKEDILELQNLFVCTADDFRADTEDLKPVMESLKNRLCQFVETVSEIKEENNAYYFTDILHFALKLLYEERGNGDLVKSDLARELQEEFDEILIDEFQDTNEAQVRLFDAVSKDNSNEFIVGDVKQSIYAFRQACPEIFVRLLDSKDIFDGKKYPAKIYLDNNFRSRKGVIDGINFIFDKLMVPKLGGLDYKKTERLVFSQTDYSERDCADVELHVVESQDARSGNLPEESRYIGGIIKNMMNDNILVGTKGKERPLQYKDICILLRNVKNKAGVMAGELMKMGIPVHYKKEGGFFDSAEVMTIISLLRIIDNPISDVPLLSVLLSPLTPFTEDDIAFFRTQSKSGSLYSSLKNIENENKNVKKFLELIDYLRTLSVTLPAAGLIRRIFEITSYDCVVGAMTSGEKRVLNLQKLVSFAESYTAGGKFGLGGFIRYTESLQKNGFDLDGADSVSENDDAVRIMTFHKSKGLEFPVVILAGTAAKFRDESKEKLPVNKQLGAGALRYLPFENREIKTQVYSSVLRKNEDDNIAENLRLLYVAMTRARERLILVGSVYKPESKIADILSSAESSDANVHVGIKKLKSFFDMILFSLASHPSFSSYPFVRCLSERKERETESKIDIHFCEDTAEFTEACSDNYQYASDPKIIAEIKEKASFVYPYRHLASVEIKHSASGLDKRRGNEFFASEIPGFLSADEITPSYRGSLIHKFMEVCDMKNASENIDGEIARLIDNGTFTENESKAIPKNKIKEFFQSSMFNRIASAELFQREKQFTLSVPLCELNDGENIPKDEIAVVQGVIDGIIMNGREIEIIDYKTDRVSSPQELCERYKSQMWVYKKAAEECFGGENVKVTLYSFELSQEISVIF